MARKIKVDNAVLKRLAYKEEKRKEDVRQKRLYYLVVCEGEKTEPLYFEALKNDLPKGVLFTCTFDIEGEGMNTTSLVAGALKLKSKKEQETSRQIDRLWVVFDKDSFSAEQFNNAIIECNNNEQIHGCAWSNEAFELWYLLHFQNLQNSWHRNQYQDKIEGYIKKKSGLEFEYKKNDPGFYSILKQFGDIHLALRFAKTLAENFEDRRDYANHNPCTMVYKLVWELFNIETELEA